MKVKEIRKLNKTEKDKYYKKKVRKMMAMSLIKPFGMHDKVSNLVEEMVETEYLTPEEGVEWMDKMIGQVESDRKMTNPKELLKEYRKKIKEGLKE